MKKICIHHGGTTTYITSKTDDGIGVNETPALDPYEIGILKIYDDGVLIASFNRWDYWISMDRDKKDE